MTLNLFAREAFDGYSKGDRITDPATIAAILAGPHMHHVAKVMVPDEVAVLPDPPSTRIPTVAEAVADGIAAGVADAEAKLHGGN